MELPSGDVVQVKDTDATDPPPPGDGGGVILDVLTDDPDAVFASAMDQGATEVFPVSDQPYGARQGRFRDPWGHQWIVGSRLTLSPAEVQETLDEVT